MGRGPALEYLFNVFGHPAAGTGVESVDELALVEGHFSFSLLHGPVALGMLGAEAAVDLALGGIAEVEPEVPVQAQVFDGIRPGGHSLGFEGLVPMESIRRQFFRDHALEVILQVENIHEDQTLGAGAKHEDASILGSFVREVAFLVGGDEVDDGLIVQSLQLIPHQHPQRMGSLLSDFLPQNPGLSDALSVQGLDVAQGLAAGEKVADADLVEIFRFTLPPGDDKDLFSGLRPEPGSQLFRLLPPGRLRDLGTELFGEYLLMALDLDLVHVLTQKPVVRTNLINLHP